MNDFAYGPNDAECGVYQGDCRALLPAVEAESVQLVVTSPPYNVGKGYDDYADNLSLDDYLAMLMDVWRECYRVLSPGGRIAVNIANVDRKPYVPLNSYIAQQLIAAGFLMRGEIIWDKGASVGSSTAWGSWLAATNPVLRDVHEYILIACKGDYHLDSGDDSGIASAEFTEWTKSIWRFPTESAKRIGHPAPFPVELPRRVILLYTGKGDVVLDPFMGSGSTGVAAFREGRRFLGFDRNESYVAMARRRIVQDAPLLVGVA